MLSVPLSHWWNMTAAVAPKRALHLQAFVTAELMMHEESFDCLDSGSLFVNRCLGPVTSVQSAVIAKPKSSTE